MHLHALSHTLWHAMPCCSTWRVLQPLELRRQAVVQQVVHNSTLMAAIGPQAGRQEVGAAQTPLRHPHKCPSQPSTLCKVPWKT